MATGPRIHTSPAVWPLGMERSQGSVDPLGERASVFGREMDRIRRPSQVAERAEARDKAAGEAESRRPEREAEAAHSERTDRAAESTPPPTAQVPPPAPMRADEEAAPGAGSEASPSDSHPQASASATATTAANPAPPTPASAAAGAAGAAPAGRPNAATGGVTPGATPASPPVRAPEGSAPGSTIQSPAASARATAPRSAAPPPPAAPFEVVLDQIRPELRPNLRQALIVLEPADLGRIAVRVRMGADGLSAVLRADSSATRDLLERHLPELRASFEAQGLSVGHLEVQLDDPRGGRHGSPGQEASAQSPRDAIESRSPNRSAGTPLRAEASQGSAIDTFA